MKKREVRHSEKKSEYEEVSAFPRVVFYGDERILLSAAERSSNGWAGKDRHSHQNGGNGPQSNFLRGREKWGKKKMSFVTMAGWEWSRG